MTPIEQALAFTLKWEGGYVNDPDDPGGATNYGVTQNVYNARRKACGLPTQSVRAITMPEVVNIYQNGYWKPAGCQTMPYPLALAIFDTSVNFGVGRADQFRRKLSNKAAACMDGGHDAAAEIVAMRKAYRYGRVALKPSQVKFLKGWLNRDNSLLAATR